jgi:hypothetical protein
MFMILNVFVVTRPRYFCFSLFYSGQKTILYFKSELRTSEAYKYDQPSYKHNFLPSTIVIDILVAMSHLLNLSVKRYIL